MLGASVEETVVISNGLDPESGFSEDLEASPEMNMLNPLGFLRTFADR